MSPTGRQWPESCSQEMENHTLGRAAAGRPRLRLIEPQICSLLPRLLHLYLALHLGPRDGGRGRPDGHFGASGPGQVSEVWAERGHAAPRAAPAGRRLAAQCTLTAALASCWPAQQSEVLARPAACVVVVLDAVVVVVVVVVAPVDWIYSPLKELELINHIPNMFKIDLINSLASGSKSLAKQQSAD